MTTLAMEPELIRWRADTPGAASRVHLNNAGASLMPSPVHAAIARHLDREMETGGYEAAEERAVQLAAASESVGRTIGAHARHIAVCQNSTAAFAHALSAFDFERGDVVLTTRADYVSNQIMYLSLARRCGIELVRAADATEGGVDPDSVRALIGQRRPTLVAVTWVPTNSGLVQPVHAIGEICAAADIPYLIDACQAVGQMPVDVKTLHCDYLTGTGRKFLRGPRGIGFLYVSDQALRAGAHPLMVDMRGATWTDADAYELVPTARRFESWELPSALVLGLGAAADYALAVGIPTAGDRAHSLAAYARERLAALPAVRVLDRGPELCAIVTIAVEGWDGADLKLQLRERGINTSSSGRTDAVIDMDAKGVTSALRLSPHYYNTADEIDRAVAAIAEITR